MTPSVTRADLDAWLSRLAERPIQSLQPAPAPPYTQWDVFPRVQTADFDPRLAGDASNAVWWTAAADAAFDASGTLTRPMRLRWCGNPLQIQRSAAQEGLGLRIVSASRSDGEGVAVLSPRPLSVPTDLMRLLAAFRALQAARTIALEDAGWTQSDGWTSVAEAQRHPRQTAVFMTYQGQESFDGDGMLQGETLCLYWRGNAERIGAALEAAGLTVTLPADEHTAVIVSSTHAPPPELATVAEAERHEIALPLAAAPPQAGGGLSVEARSATLRSPEEDRAIGFPVVSLWPSPDGTRLAVVQGNSIRGLPERWLWLRSLETLRLLDDRPEIADSTQVSGLAWLSPTRLLLVWRDYCGFQQPSQLVLSAWEDGQTHEVLRLPDSHLASRGTLAVDAQGQAAVLARPSGLIVRAIGPEGTHARQPRPGVRVRRANPSLRPPEDWQEVASLRDEGGGDAYAMVACTPDGRTLLRTTDGSYRLTAWDRQSGAVLWQGNPMDQHAGSRGTRQLTVTPDGALVQAYTVRGQTSEHHTVLLDARTGARSQPRLEAALVGASAVAFDPSGRWVAAGMADGALRILRRTDAAEVARLQPFAHGGVSALAWLGPAGAALVAGSSRGELCRLRWSAAAGAAP